VRRRAVFLDRDGVINVPLWNPVEGKWDSPYRLEDFRLLPGAAQAIRLINEMGYLAVVVSNQPGVAKGKCSPELLDAITRKMLSELGQEGAWLDAIYYCLHHPEARVEALRVVCYCRKPKPGLLLQAARDLGIDLEHSYLIGDQRVDIEAGLAVGCRSILVNGLGPVIKEMLVGGSPPPVASSLLTAVQEYIAQEVSPWRYSLTRLM